MGKASDIATYIVVSACENTLSGNWTAYPDDISEKCGISENEYIRIIEHVIGELQTRDEIIEVIDVGDGTLDLKMKRNYCHRLKRRSKIYE